MQKGNNNTKLTTNPVCYTVRYRKQRLPNLIVELPMHNALCPKTILGLPKLLYKVCAIHLRQVGGLALVR